VFNTLGGKSSCPYEENTVREKRCFNGTVHKLHSEVVEFIKKYHSALCFWRKHQFVYTI